MRSPSTDSMTRDERRAGGALAAIFSLRMLGLFLILPIFSVHAREIPGGDNLTLVGVALGAYGMTQALLYIPYGMLSDRLGRKPVIIAGLLLFAFGSVLAALSTGIWGIILGRVVQGAGAISSAVTALAADLTREQHRTKVMAMIGSSIGAVFAISLVLAPTLYELIGLSGIFWMTGALAIAAIGLVTNVVPNPPPPAPGPRVPFREVLSNPQLLRLNFGIAVLHLMQTSMFVVVPTLLVSSGGLPVAKHWQVYLPAVLASFVLMVPAIIYGEKRNKLKQVFVAAVALMVVAQLGFWLGDGRFWPTAAMLLTFFVGFNILEASLPSLISRIAPARAKGAALGVYNTTQAVGLALGGVLGGVLAKQMGSMAVFLVNAVLAVLWLLLAISMNPPPLRAVAAPAADPAKS